MTDTFVIMICLPDINLLFLRTKNNNLLTINNVN